MCTPAYTHTHMLTLRAAQWCEESQVPGGPTGGGGAVREYRREQMTGRQGILSLNISPFVLVISTITRHCTIYRDQKFSLHMKNTGKPGTEAKISGIPLVRIIAVIQWRWGVKLAEKSVLFFNWKYEECIWYSFTDDCISTVSQMIVNFYWYIIKTPKWSKPLLIPLLTLLKEMMQQLCITEKGAGISFIP